MVKVKTLKRKMSLKKKNVAATSSTSSIYCLNNAENFSRDF